MVFGQWYKFVVKQMKNAAGQYVYTVDIDGTRVHEVVNTDPRKEFKITKISLIFKFYHYYALTFYIY